MKIISWNCNGAFRKKFEKINELNADIYIIQECEDPKFSNNKEYQIWSKDYIWTGNNKNKGLGVFAKNGLKLDLLSWSNQYQDHNVKHFLPCLINNDFQLLAVWTSQNNSPNFGYVGQLWKYLQINKNNFNNIILAGDFNSNTIWDEWDRWWNHSDVVKELSSLDISSLYHDYFKQKQGQELTPTFYLHRNLDKPYHIDYFFASKVISQKLMNFELGNIDTWLKFSDHLPIICEFSDINI